VAGFATQTPQDYSLAMKKAAEITAGAAQPDKEVGYTAGVPAETYKRQARIYVPARSPSQSGFAKTLHASAQAPQWKIVFDTTAKWENPLIGWTSTADPLENVGRASLFFYTKEQAMAFCKKHGWEYTVDEPNERRTVRQKRYMGYGDNYSVKRKGVPDLTHLPSVRLGLGTPTN